MYDRLIVTGCSLSTGMEFNDEQLGKFSNEKERNIEIIKWYKNNFDYENNEVTKLYQNAQERWHCQERVKSWPEQLKGIVAKEIINLSEKASSIGKNYLDFKTYLEKTESDKKTLISIHQLPSIYRHYVRFDETSKVNCVPTSINFHHNKDFFKKQISKTLKRYRNFLKDDVYLIKYYQRIIKRIEYQAQKRGIRNFFMFNSPEHIPEHILEQKIIIKNFDEFRAKFKHGVLGHPVDQNYNEEILKICKTNLGIC